MQQEWIGIDVSKAELAVCVMNEQREVQQATFANGTKGFRSLANYLKKRVAVGSAVCMEATGSYGDALAAYLHERKYRVSVVNPLRIKHYAESQLRRNKTDRLDAEIIADFCRTQDVPQWTPPDPAWVELRALVRLLDDLIQMEVQERQRLQTTPSPTVQAHLQDHLRYLATQIEQVLAQIKQHIDQDPDLKHQQTLLNSIPGISDKTSSRLLAEIRDITAFETVGQLVAFAGLNPRQRQSGRYRGQVKISKMGNAALRAALFMPARCAKRHNPLVRDLVMRMEAQGYCPNAVTVAVMRKLLHYVFGVLKSGQPFDPHYLTKPALPS
ncbi:MAG: IS110 family transposase [Desulfobulbaceae bacterium]|nr:MAG: IS110 family transposase [Desulfobulbaceae bacterium]